MRIVEFLHGGKDEAMETKRRRRRKRRGLRLRLSPSSSSSSSDCFSPRSLLSRLFPAYCYSGEVEENEGKKKEMEEEEEEEEGMELVASPVLPLESSAREGGTKPEEVSLNLGMSVGLVLLLTKSATELNKMVEMRKQMETMLTDIKNEIDKKNVSSSFGQSNSCLITGSSGCGDNRASYFISMQEDQTSYCLETVENAVNADKHPNCHQGSINQGGIVMDQLEVELEVELKRLQCNRQGKSSVLQKGRMEMASGKSVLSESSTASCGEDSCGEDGETKEEEEDSPPQCGVSARELERRLYELIQSRQQERIAELESALACAEKKLREKEREVFWWRDTARLVSQHEESESHCKAGTRAQKARNSEQDEALEIISQLSFS